MDPVVAATAKPTRMDTPVKAKAKFAPIMAPNAPPARASTSQKRSILLANVNTESGVIPSSLKRDGAAIVGGGMGRFRGHGGCRPRECPRAGPGGARRAELQGRYALWAVRAPGTGREGSAS